MIKRTVFAIAAVFYACSAIDFIVHFVILKGSYAASAQLWRPMEEMNMMLMHVMWIISASCFTLIYALLVQTKSIGSGVTFGLLFGIGAGISMGFGTYSIMPIPLFIAVVWSFGTLVEAVTGGILVGLIVKTGKKTVNERS